MDNNILSPEFLENLQIPIDLFISKKRRGEGGLSFTDAAGDLAFIIQRRRSITESTHLRVVVDTSGNPLISITRDIKGCWQVFKGDVCIEENLIFRVEEKLYRVSKAEFKILPFCEVGEVSTDFKMKGSPFHRACTIYKGDSIIAQTSLMYKLGIQKVIVPRHRFRLTIFPEFKDHASVVALIGIFFHGRKLWI